MTKEELAAQLDGIQQSRDVIPHEYYPALVENGLAVVTGGSDHLCYFIFPKSGKVATEELRCWEGETFWFDKELTRFFEDDAECRGERYRNSIQALWFKEKAPDGGIYPWAYRTEIPHATFSVVSRDVDGDSYHYCKAIVFSVKDLK